MIEYMNEYGLIFYYFSFNSSETLIYGIYFASWFSFLIAVILNSFVTMILSSYVRAIFIYFALNPTALGATHPDELKQLTNVWQQVYPQEYTNSNYDEYLPLISTKENVWMRKKNISHFSFFYFHIF